MNETQLRTKWVENSGSIEPPSECARGALQALEDAGAIVLWPVDDQSLSYEQRSDAIRGLMAVVASLESDPERQYVPLSREEK